MSAKKGKLRRIGEWGRARAMEEYRLGDKQDSKRHKDSTWEEQKNNVYMRMQKQPDYWT